MVREFLVGLFALVVPRRSGNVVLGCLLVVVADNVNLILLAVGCLVLVGSVLVGPTADTVHEGVRTKVATSVTPWCR